MKDSEPKDAAGRLRESRVKAGFNSARSAAMRFGWTPSTYASHENGQTPVPQDMAVSYAKAFKVSYVWLLTGENPGNDVVQILANVSKAGMVVELVDAKVAPWIWLPFGVAADADILRVADTSLSPRYELGDIIICEDVVPAEGESLEQLLAGLIGREAIAVGETGTFFGTIVAGHHAGRLDLAGPNGPSARNLKLLSAHPAIASVRSWAVADLHPGKAKAIKKSRERYVNRNSVDINSVND
jgi:hypothetical protein